MVFQDFFLKFYMAAWHHTHTHTHTQYNNTRAGKWERPINFIHRFMSCVVTSPMIILEINVEFLEQGTNIQIPEKCKQCMQIRNMSLKWSPRYTGLGAELVTASLSVVVSHQNKEKMGGKWKNNKNPFPSLSLKGNQQNNDLKHNCHHWCCHCPLHSSGDWEIMGILKSLKLLAEKPQCKSSGNARNVSTDPTLRILQNENSFSSPKSPWPGLHPACMHTVHTCDSNVTHQCGL